MQLGSIAASGLRAATTRLGVAAHNVANVSTDGYQPARTVALEERGGGVSARVERPEVAGVGRVSGEHDAEAGSGSEVDLGGETVQEMLAQRAFSANLAVLRTADEVASELVRRRA